MPHHATLRRVGVTTVDACALWFLGVEPNFCFLKLGILIDGFDGLEASAQCSGS